MSRRFDVGTNRFATFVATVTYDVLKGQLEKTKQMVIYRGEGKQIPAAEMQLHAKVERETGLKVCWEKSSWFRDEQLHLWIQHVLRPLAEGGKKVLLLLDSYAVHKSPANLEKLKLYADVAVIPGSLTLMVQYLDVHCFARFKTALYS